MDYKTRGLKAYLSAIEMSKPPIKTTVVKKGADDGEIYDDGTAIKNISVAGVATKAAMFEPKSGQTTPPVLRKFRNQQNANSASTSQTGPTVSPKPTAIENKTPPWVVKKVDNGTTPKSPVSPPTIPQISSKPSTVYKPQSNIGSQNIPIRKLSSDPPAIPFKKDINHNVKSESVPVKASITKTNKRASVTDMLKSFQSESSTNSSEPVITNVRPLQDTTPVFTTEKFKSQTEEPKSANLVKKTSIQERIAALSKNNSSNESVDLRTGSGTVPTWKKRNSRRQSVIKREKDNTTFKRVNVNKIDSEEPPSKPPKLTNLDLNQIKLDYKQVLHKYGKLERLTDIATEEDDEIYDDIGNVQQGIRPVSCIQPMTEEEEYDDVGNLLSRGKPSETYELAENDELYEPLDEEHISGGSNTSKSKEKDKENQEKKKRDEKERKDQEKKDKEEKKKKDKEEKDRQNKLKKKEKEEKDRLSKLKADGTEKPLAEGVVIGDYNGVKLELSVKKGEKVVIMRMDKNPKGKWLIGNSEGKWGYVEADNVEVATPTIRQIMSHQESYANPDDLSENGIGEMDDLYEEL